MRLKTVLPYLGMAALVIAFYHPCLKLVARADQLVYLFHTSDIKDDLHQLTLGSYAFNRDRNGDSHFFRPALYLWLGLERWMFGFNFSSWQAASLALHLGVTLGLLHLFRRWFGERSALAFVLAGFF